MVGQGWAVSGLSAITRCPKTFAQNGMAREVRLDLNDRFCLDGQQLMLVSGIYGAAGAEYRTEVESYARIRSYGSAGNGPAYFVVERKDGTIGEYGNTADSRIESLASGSGTARAWAINQLRDRADNRINFTYGEDGTNGSYRISLITWTTNPTAGIPAAAYVMTFVYEAQQAGVYTGGYFVGGPVKQVNRLARIDVTSSGSLVRRYNLAYNPNLSTASASRLDSVTECGGTAGTDCLPATQFTYQPGTQGIGAGSTAALTTFAARQMPMDVNGDGRTDLVYAGGTSSGSATWHVRFGAAGGFGSDVDTGISATAYADTISIDYNADGLRDLLIPVSGTWQVALGNASGFSTPTSIGIPAALGGDFYSGAADVTGDGLEDLVYIQTTGSGDALMYRARVWGGTFQSTASALIPANGYTLITQARFGTPGQTPDFNGDGIGDLLVRLAEGDPEGGYNVFDQLVLGGGAGSYQVDVSDGIASVGLYNFTDLNSDGYTDIVYVKNSTIRYRYSTGAGLTAAAYGPSTLTTGSGIGALIDWDGDGLKDLVSRGTSGSWVGYWVFFRSNGSGFDNGVNTFAPVSAISGSLYGVPDLNGDGLDDIVALQGTNTVYSALHAGAYPDLLDVATDGYGNFVNFDYTTLAQASYTKNADATFPYQDYQGPLSVVSQYSASNGIGGSYANYLWYYGAWIHRQGRGFMGFSAQRPYDSRTGINDYHFYRRPFPYTGLEENHHPYTSAWTLISQDNVAWTYATPTWTAIEPTYAVYSHQSSHYRYELEGTFNGAQMSVATASRAFDSGTGTVTDETVLTTENSTGNGLFAGQTWSVRRYLPSVLNDVTNWCIGRPQTQQEIRVHSGAEGISRTRTVGFEWDGPKCRTSKSKIEPGDPQWQVITDYGYDAFGNVNVETVTGIGMTGRTTQTYWGATGQFPHSVINPASEGMSQSWDLGLGVIVGQTDPNSLTTTFTYDNFGRQTRVSYPDGTRTDTEWTWCSGCGSQIKLRKANTHYGVGVGAPVLGYDAVYLDLEDRAKYDYRWVERMSAYQMVIRSYDSRGRVYTESLPYLSSGAPYYQTFEFDLLSRVKSVARPISAANSTLQYEYTYYEGFKMRQVDAESKQKTVYRNAGGRIVRSVDHNGYYQNFVYDSFGNTKEVVDSANNSLQTGMFNVRGMRYASTDIDLGSWGYAFNALGELSGYTDAKSQTTNFTYDAVGRKTLQTTAVSGGTLTRQWVYGTSSANKNVGKRTSAQISGPGVAAYSEAYLYDSVGRLSHKEHNNGSSVFAFDYSFSATTAQLETVTYPTSTSSYRFKILNEYSGVDLLRVKDYNAPTTIFWQANALDGRLNVTDETRAVTDTANKYGIRTTRQYDAVHGLPDWIRTGMNSGSAIQNLNYAWDKVGNLTSRNDANQAITESFVYDNLYRLDYSQRNGSTNWDYSYDQYGNLTYKSDVGAYTYGSSRIHAATQVNGVSYTYDGNGNIATRGGATVTWSPSNMPRSIPGGGYTAAFDYDADDQYWRQVSTYSNGTETSQYFGGLLEVVSNSSTGITAWRHQVPAGDRKIAVYTRGSNGTNTTFYPLEDHLGSTDAVTDSAGTVLVRESFSAFGRRRGSNWTGLPSGTEMAAIANLTRRGFTQHSMVDNLDLVHMNGRVFEPVIGRFLAGDPFIDGELDTQGWNRYSYVQNNPLSSWDPAGFDSVRRDGPSIVVNVSPSGLEEVTVRGRRTLAERMDALARLARIGAVYDALRWRRTARVSEGGGRRSSQTSEPASAPAAPSEKDACQNSGRNGGTSFGGRAVENAVAMNSALESAGGSLAKRMGRAYVTGVVVERLWGTKEMSVFRTWLAGGAPISTNYGYLSGGARVMGAVGTSMATGTAVSFSLAAGARVGSYIGAVQIPFSNGDTIVDAVANALTSEFGVTGNIPAGSIPDELRCGW